MDTVPFAFCDSVVGTIRQLSRINGSFSDAQWNCAIQEHKSNRKSFPVDLCFNSDKWTCNFDHTEFDPATPLSDLIERVGTKHFRIDDFNLKNNSCIHDVPENNPEAFVKRLLPYMNAPVVPACGGLEDLPEAVIDRILSCFEEINIRSFSSSRERPCYKKFVKTLMEKDTLVKQISFHDTKDEFSVDLERFRQIRKDVIVCQTIGSGFKMFKCASCLSPPYRNHY